ncbi:hypothetical protein [Chryseobacterium sp. Leaf180]|nr:hypothetical protein [Chryseobacterium sp. Leaf180]
MQRKLGTRILVKKIGFTKERLKETFKTVGTSVVALQKYLGK